MPYVAIERALIALSCLALGTGLAQAQAMYKWVDEKGTTHFSENPPPEDAKTRTKATKVEPKVIPPSSPPSADSPEKWQKQEQEFKKRQIERNQKEQAASREQAEKSRSCDSARRRLAFLTNSSRIYRDNADGTRTYMTDEQRDQELARQRDVVKESCG